jgi:hypothetical protein
MPYIHFTSDERIALQAMVGMRLSKCYIAVISPDRIAGRVSVEGIELTKLNIFPKST